MATIVDGDGVIVGVAELVDISACRLGTSTLHLAAANAPIV